MANREATLGSGTLGILQGDVLTSPGSPNVTVVGLQGVPIGPNTFVNGGVYQYNASTNTFVMVQSGASISVNGIAISDDYIISVNAQWVYINGTPSPQ
jgi:uncharacterized protein with beta-barrel porin domain